MFYKAVKWVLILAVLLSLVMVVGMANGWFGLGRALFVLQLLVITLGLYMFYQSRPGGAGQGGMMHVLRGIVHIAVLPVSIVAVLCIQNEWLGTHYWYVVNLVLVAFLGVTVTGVLVKLPFKNGYKLPLALLVLAYTVVVCLQMAGMFNQGKIVLFGTLVVLVFSVLAVLFGIKPKKETGDAKLKSEI